MGRNTFFSFCYEDVRNFKANVVRNSWRMSNNTNCFVDGSIWEKEKSKGSVVIKNLIAEGLNRTSVTAILIGSDTANRRWVKYEIVKSFERGNGILAVHLNRLKGREGYITAKGANPLDRLSLHISEDGKSISFFELLNRRWIKFADLPQISNKKSNTLFFERSFWGYSDFGKTFRFSDMFETYCWIGDGGPGCFSNWVEKAAKAAGR